MLDLKSYLTDIDALIWTQDARCHKQITIDDIPLYTTYCYKLGIYMLKYVCVQHEVEQLQQRVQGSCFDTEYAIK